MVEGARVAQILADLDAAQAEAAQGVDLAAVGDAKAAAGEGMVHPAEVQLHEHARTQAVDINKEVGRSRHGQQHISMPAVPAGMCCISVSRICNLRILGAVRS